MSISNSYQIHISHGDYMEKIATLPARHCMEAASIFLAKHPDHEKCLAIGPGYMCPENTVSGLYERGTCSGVGGDYQASPVNIDCI